MRGGLPNRVPGLYQFPADLEATIREHAGMDADSIERTARAVGRLSNLFVGLRPWQPEYAGDPELREAYLAYFLPVNLPKVRVPLEAWLRASPRAFAGRRLRVLDLGSGPGTSLLGLADFVRDLEPDARPVELDFIAVDRSGESLRNAERLLASFGRVEPRLPPIRFAAVRSDVVGEEALVPLAAAGGRFDLVIAQNVLCELADRAERLIVAAVDEALAHEGALVLIEPGLRETARALERLRDRLLERGTLSVLAPCLHQAHCPALVNERDWCITDFAWTPPPFVRAIDERTGLDKRSLKFAYLLLARERVSVGDPSRWRVVSDPLDLKGEIRVYLCGAERWIVVRELKRGKSELAAAIAGLRRGDLIEVDGLEPRGTLHRAGKLRRVHETPKLASPP